MTYAIWKPEHYGHAPPNWRKGMKWAIADFPSSYDASGIPGWSPVEVYHVEPEALNSPNEDASGDVDTWKHDDAVEAYNSALIEKAVKSLRAYPAEKLAKHGVKLEPPKDWATELWAEAKRLYFNGCPNEEVTDFIRTRFEQMKGEG